MSKTKNNGAKKTAGGFSAIVAFLAMAFALVAGILIFKYVFGDPSNFVDNDPTGEPMEKPVISSDPMTLIMSFMIPSNSEMIVKKKMNNFKAFYQNDKQK